MVQTNCKPNAVPNDSVLLPVCIVCVWAVIRVMRERERERERECVCV